MVYMKNESKKFVIMADDDEDDRSVAYEAFCECGPTASFFTVPDGSALISFLSVRSKDTPSELPSLILLDLNMPLKNGHEALKEIRSNRTFNKIHIVILTSSREECDRVLGKIEGADGIRTKPNTYSEWVHMMKSICDTWLI